MTGATTRLHTTSRNSAPTPAGQEPDPKKREELVKAALREYRTQAHMIPLHRQVVPWATRTGVDVVHRADNVLEVIWVTMR